MKTIHVGLLVDGAGYTRLVPMKSQLVKFYVPIIRTTSAKADASSALQLQHVEFTFRAWATSVITAEAQEPHGKEDITLLMSAYFQLDPADTPRMKSPMPIDLAGIRTDINRLILRSTFEAVEWQVEQHRPPA